MPTSTFRIETPTPRLDQFLVSQGLFTSRSQISRWIKQGCVTLNALKAKASQTLKVGDIITVSLPATREAQLTPEDIPLKVLYEDSNLIVINKSPDMVVHPGAGHEKGTLTHALLAHCKDLSGIGGVMRPGIVHRLDKGTSGVIVIAKNDTAHVVLSNQFKSRQVKKIYWALVYGRMKKEEGTIKSYITRSPRHRKKFSVSEVKGKEAITHYRVLKEGEGVQLLELKLETGRTHQIRVHLTDAGHSIVGDPLYGGHARKVRQIGNLEVRHYFESLDHTLLHARSLQFKHPAKNETMEFVAEVPNDFKKALSLCF